jgi:hypothetical protein
MDARSKPPPGQGKPQGEPRSAEIDVERLADKVYRLMLAELRRELARGAAPPGERRHA